MFLPWLVAAAGCGGPPGPGAVRVPSAGSGVLVAGYHAWWAGDAWTAYPLDALDRLYLFEVELTAQGTLGDTHGWPERWVALTGAARRAGVSVVPTVTVHPEAAVEALLGDPASVRRAAATVTSLLSAHPEFDGVHLDLEIFRPVAPSTREGYVDLARQIRQGLDRLRSGTVLSVFLPALDLSDAYDEAGLAEVADYVVVQGYDLHHRTGERAGPVAAVRGWAPLDWTTVVDRLVGMGLAPESLVMGVPLYGYRWPTEGPEPGSPTRGPGVILPLSAPPDVLPELPRAEGEARRHGVARDPASDSPYFAYRDEDGWVQGWFEDARSLRDKLSFVERHGLGGVAYFPLAYGGGDVREVLRTPGRGGEGRR